MLALDTDVLAVYHVFHKDPRFESTKLFFRKMNGQIKGVTIFNLLELCGIFASANRKKDSRTVFNKYLAAEDISLLFPDLTEQDEKEFWSILVSESFSRIQKGMRLGDAVILWTLETNNIDTFITWNTRHFKGKSSINIVTPGEY